MLDNKIFGAFIVPTGVGASIGGYAGDASAYARKFSEYHKIIVNPNVVNAGGFSGITNNMFYVEGYSLDEFFKGKLKLIESKHNKIGIVFDKEIPSDVLNVHINTLNATKCIYGIDINSYEITKEKVGVKFKIENGISTGSIKNPQTLLESSKSLILKGCNAIAIVCFFEESDYENPDYAKGIGIDPVGGVEAVISHYISKELRIPCAHSPAFKDYQINPDIVDIRSASEYITPTFLPCILLGLDNAPQFSKTQGISINELDYLVMPYNSLGSIPVFEMLKRNKKIFAVKENSTELDITPKKISDKIIIAESYDEVLKKIYS